MPRLWYIYPFANLYFDTGAFLNRVAAN